MTTKISVTDVGTKPLDLTAFKEQLKIVLEEKDSSGNELYSYGTLNAACWIGEHSGSLIKEIERLREDLTRLQDLAEIAARIAANEKQGMRRDSYSQDCLFIKLEQEMEKVSIPVKPSETSANENIFPSSIHCSAKTQ